MRRLSSLADASRLPSSTSARIRVRFGWLTIQLSLERWAGHGWRLILFFAVFLTNANQTELILDNPNFRC